jgi:hypothetical protein
MILQRYAALPDDAKRDALLEWIDEEPDSGLCALVLQIIFKEGPLGAQESTTIMDVMEVVESELEKSGLPREIL